MLTIPLPCNEAMNKSDVISGVTKSCIKVLQNRMMEWGTKAQRYCKAGMLDGWSTGILEILSSIVSFRTNVRNLKKDLSGLAAVRDDRLGYIAGRSTFLTKMLKQSCHFERMWEFLWLLYIMKNISRWADFMISRILILPSWSIPSKVSCLFNSLAGTANAVLAACCGVSERIW